MDERYAGVLARFDGEIGAGRVTVHRGQSDDGLRALADESLDWVYIDGNHLYEYVAQDLRLSLAKVKPGGLVTGDDYAEGGWWEGGVKRAVDELAARGRRGWCWSTTGSTPSKSPWNEQRYPWYERWDREASSGQAGVDPGDG